jgi:hypothetical protein
LNSFFLEPICGYIYVWLITLWIWVVRLEVWSRSSSVQW